MTLNLHARWLKLLHTLWFVPSAIAVAYIALAQVLVKLDADERFSNMWVFGGGAHAARTVLSVIAGSLITVAGLTFSLTMIVLQLTSSQFSPRVVRNYLGDRIAQVTIGSFVGIFAFCLLALRSVGDQSEQPAVPRLTVTVASGLALFALAMLIAFIHHIAQLVQASELSGRLGRETLEAIERLYPSHFGEAVTPTSRRISLSVGAARNPPESSSPIIRDSSRASSCQILWERSPIRTHGFTCSWRRAISRTPTSPLRRSGRLPASTAPAMSSCATSPRAGSVTSTKKHIATLGS